MNFQDDQDLPPAGMVVQPPTAPQPQIDQRLIDRALRRMKGLVHGNGAWAKDVKLISHDIKMIRFPARTTLKLSAEHAMRIEPGRNMTAEAVPTEEEFRRTLHMLPQLAVSNPDTKKMITDIAFARTDKGFGINDQRMEFHALRKTLVVHEKCAQCKNMGRTVCINCQGQKVLNCINCQGRRQIVCPRCRGTARIQTPKGADPCTFCHADGRITCPQCVGTGQIKCPKCASTGYIPCQYCAASGWMSHIATINMYATTLFEYDRSNLPPFLVGEMEQRAARLVQKNDIEVALVHPHASELGMQTSQLNDKHAVKDTLVLDYNVTCPIGPISFDVNGNTISGVMFGFQARLMEMPPFLDTMTKKGQDALRATVASRKWTPQLLRRAIKYALIKDILTKTLQIKNTAKAHMFLTEKYAVGINPDRLEELVTLSGQILHRTTRISRYTGMVCGLIIYAVLYSLLALKFDPQSLPQIGVPGLTFWILLLGSPFAGYGLSVLFARMLGIIFQIQALAGIIDSAHLKKNFPAAGKTRIGSAVGTSIITLIILAIGWLQGNIVPPVLPFLNL